MAINWNRRSYSQEEFVSAYNESISIAEVARRLGLTIYGSTYKTIRNTAEELNLDGSHLLGRGWNKGLKVKFAPEAIPIEDYLVEGTTISSYALKHKLFNAGIKQKKCEICALENWQGQPAPLALDHINGVNNDNRLENLRILCYNCHGQTDTFCRGRGKKQNAGMKKKAKAKELKKTESKKKQVANLEKGRISSIQWPTPDEVVERAKTESLASIGRSLGTGGNSVREFLRRNGRFEEVRKQKHQPVQWPETDQLIEMIRSTNYSEVGRTLGCTDNAIRKYLKRRGVDLSEL